MTYSSNRSGFTPRSPSPTGAPLASAHRAAGRSNAPRPGHSVYSLIAILLAAAGWSACSGGEPQGGPSSSSSASGASGAGGGSSGSGGGAGAGGEGTMACGASPNVDASVLRDECGVFVMPGGSDKNGDGSEVAPLETLDKAITLAISSKKNIVFACRGTYSEPAVVPPGVSLFGGLDCDGAAWAPRGDAGTDRTTIQGDPGEIPLRFTGSDAAAPALLDGFSAIAAAATAAGGSSIAALAEDNAVVTLSSCDLIAGDAAPGAPGEDAQVELPATTQPSDVNKGAAACSTAVLNIGGAPLENMCETGEFSIGGAGGQASTLLGQNGLDGAPDNASMPQSGMGGTGDMPCEVGKGNGTPGASGVDGAPGVGGLGMGDGSLSIADGWVGVSGGDGALGTVGEGGGGGGGQKGKIGCAGASGGAGGAGGCGGKGGKGGQAGGSSIALISINASITMAKTTLVAGNGGAGGNGGNAQGGGIGSPGSPGGTGAMGTPSGCAGGVGGKGGDGGSGGGGSGGHSLGVAHQGAAPAGDFVVMRGVKGAAGLGGNGDFKGNGGEAGKEADALEFLSP